MPSVLIMRLRSPGRPGRLRRLRRPGHPGRLSLAAGVACLLLAGCGGAGHHTGAGPAKLPAAEPAHDPVAAAKPAGRSVRVGADPQGIAVQTADGLVAVGVHNPSSIVVLSARTGRVLKRIQIAAAPRHLMAGGPDGPLLVPEEGVNQLLVLALPSGRGRSYRVGDFPHDATMVGPKIFVGDERGRSLSEIFPDGTVKRISGFQQPGGLVTIGSDIGVVDVGAFTLTLLDTTNDRVLGRLPAGRGPTHDATAGNRIYVLDTRGNEVLTYSVHPFALLGRTRVPGAPYGVALDPVRHHLWVTQTGLNRVAELSLTGRLPRIIRTFATGVQPDTVAVDTVTGRVFVANQIAGTVQIIDPPG